MPSDPTSPALHRARAAFATQFGRAPRLAGIAPGRVNLIGEHTDYNEGFVLPIAIDRVCAVAAAPASDARVCRVYAADLDEMWTFPRGAAMPDLMKPGAVGHFNKGSWQSYIAGVLHFVGRAAGVKAPALDLAIASDVPLGSGLSSSASLEIAVAMAIAPAADLKSIALQCQQAEHEFAGVPCGIMDQYISAMGLKDHALLIDCRSNEATPVRLPQGIAIVIANSGVRHSLAAGEYAARRAACEAAARKLGVASLRDATMPMMSASALTDELRRCAKHVITENTRTIGSATALKSGDLEKFGRLMLQSHESLRDDYRVSCVELDTLVAIASSQPGVYGARMTGGGFGGCIVALVQERSVGAVEGELKEQYQRAHKRRCDVLITRASAGAHSIMF